ncbi:MAG: HlyC/CorC family transporter [Kofleriaceae bacterium]|nr:HlyC/CorC family transporter [Myxococcales bacterium]MCB9560056.1 HlyC/CorC family transporter [Kofleriaceae bacterium]MCB9571891.1 HlyC/CorC family transporter [Kofleriaceae bacterium]
MLILLNGLFAGTEIAVLSVRATRLRERVAGRDRRAIAVEALRAHPERFLATVQIGITVVGSTAAAFGGANLARDLAPILAHAGLGSHAQDVAMVVVVASIAFLSLVLGELVPKSLALRYADGYAFALARPMLWLARAARPLVWFLTACSNLVLRVFGDRTSFTESRMSREELRLLVEDAARAGAVDPRSSAIASRALAYDEVTVAELMVPRERIVALRRDIPADLLRRVLLEEGHSRMPVYQGSLDGIVGYVIARDLLSVAWGDGLIVLDDILRPAYVVPETTRGAVVLREMQARRIQMAIVVDEHGAVTGLVTIEDLVEELVGDIIGEHDRPEDVVQCEPTGTALVPGWAPIRKVNRALDTRLPTGRDSRTIAGLCMSIALAIPAAGARLRAPDGTVLEVVDASARRVRLVRVHPPGPEDEAGGAAPPT